MVILLSLKVKLKVMMLYDNRFTRTETDNILSDEQTAKLLKPIYQKCEGDFVKVEERSPQEKRVKESQYRER